ncbi:MAG: glycosyltransferase [Acetobacter sp.]|nr:glycosyltransferase [Bacteroides sp.]MCM1341135.1 glycosyltransferase [Acetobacter sp.]MCM1433531.1 glycosyltransferase [Clostridiales bacterium]
MKTTKGMLSVLIPAYNASKFIKDCLNSIVNQSYKNFEVIIVNDGSTDNTAEILSLYEKNDSRVKVISQKNGGVSSARNTALKHATGEFVTFIDADDSVTKDSFKTMVELMSDDVDMIVFSHNEIRLKSKPKHENPNEFINKDDINERFQDFDNVIWWPWAKIFRRSIIAENNLEYDTSMTFGEDHIFNLLFAKHIKGKALISDKIVYNYHFIRGGLSSKYYAEMHNMQKYIYFKIADYFGGNDLMPRKYQSLYAGNYLKGCVEYYIAWLPLKKSPDKIKECFEIYSDITDKKILQEYFSDKLISLAESHDYNGFVKEYIKEYPKNTLWRKFRRTIRRALEAII